jgi:hypothetical protein
MDRTKESQIFFLDAKSKTIKNVMDKEASIDIQGAGSSSNLQIWRTGARWFQLFKYENGFFVNIKNNKVFDVANGNDVEGANLMVFKKHGGISQQFDLLYADELKPEISKGDFNPEFGMYVEKDFMI